jgi:outer membrane protein assembly factor BamB
MGGRRRPGTCLLSIRSFRVPITVAALGLALCCPLAAGGSASPLDTGSSSPSWPQFQGGPAHLGTASSSNLAPPLRQVWRFEAPGKERGLSAPVVAQNLAIAVGREGVYAVHLDDGTLAWKLPRDGGPKVAAPAVAGTGRKAMLLFTDGERAKTSRLRAYDVATQKHLWDATLQDVGSSGVSVDGDKAFLGDRSGTLYAVDIHSGSIDWKFEGGGVVPAPPAVGSGRVYVVTANNSTGGAELDAVDEGTGRRSWTFAPAQVSQFGGSPTLLRGSVVTCFSDRTVYALNPTTGDVRWSSPLASAASPFAGGAVVAQDVVVAGSLPFSAGTGVYRFAGGSGQRRWWFQFDSSSLLGSPVVMGRSLVLGLQDGRVVAVDVDSGHEVWEQGTGHGAVGAVAIAGDALVLSKDGAHGGLLGFGPDPDGHLVDVESPTELHVGSSLLNYAVAFAGVAGGVLLLAALVGRLRGRPGKPRTEVEPT